MMMTLKRIARYVLGSAMLLAASGCVGDPRTTNQGGGSLLSAASKLMERNIGDLTADEWQILGDNVPQLASQFGYQIAVPTLTDEQAAAIVDFLNAKGIKTIDDLTTAIDSGQIDEDDIPPELLELT